MRLVRNSGTDRGVDSLREWLTQGTNVDLVSPSFSLFAFAELWDALDRVERCRLLLGEPDAILPGLFGGDADIASRGSLQGRWLARLASDWIKKRAEIRHARKAPPQSLVLVDGKPSLHRAMLGTRSFTTEGLGVTPGGRLGLVQATESDAEVADFAEWFRSNWDDLEPNPSAKAHLLEVLDDVGSQRAPSLVYFQILYQMFKDLGDELDEERIIKSATGIRNTVVWKKLFHFQRDGVTGAIDKLERIGGCIIADSVGLGKTFEALAVIKYYELRNDRVLVLCPKRLRDNWTLYKTNDRRNVLAPDRLNYDVLNHTDLSRDGGLSGDIDLTNSADRSKVSAAVPDDLGGLVDQLPSLRTGEGVFLGEVMPIPSRVRVRKAKQKPVGDDPKLPDVWQVPDRPDGNLYTQALANWRAQSTSAEVDNNQDEGGGEPGDA